MNKPQTATTLALLIGLLLAIPAQALPEDAEQEIHIEADSSEVYLNEGRVVYFGQADNPAVITQGTMKIMGQEITIVRRDGELRSITALGNPAHFEQQPAIDQGILYANGDNITYDSDSQVLTVEEGARFRQDGNSMNGHRIIYNLETRVARAISASDDERVNMVIVPQQAQAQQEQEQEQEQDLVLELELSPEPEPAETPEQEQ